MAVSDDVELVDCQSCGATNRVPKGRLRPGAKPVCGRCKTPLRLAGGPTTVTDSNFAAEVERSPLPVLLDMWAPWCGPCRMVAPIVGELASEMTGRIKVGKLNVDENPLTAARFNVQSIPTLLILRSGREIGRIVGALQKQEIVRRIESLL